MTCIKHTAQEVKCQFTCWQQNNFIPLREQKLCESTANFIKFHLSPAIATQLLKSQQPTYKSQTKLFMELPEVLWRTSSKSNELQDHRKTFIDCTALNKTTCKGVAALTSGYYNSWFFPSQLFKRMEVQNLPYLNQTWIREKAKFLALCWSQSQIY